MASASTPTSTPTFSFSGVSPALLRELAEAMVTYNSPLLSMEELEVLRSPEALIFKHRHGYSFCRLLPATNEVESLRAYIRNPRVGAFMPITYEIPAEACDTLPTQILERFSKFKRGAETRIDWITYQFASTSRQALLILLVPKEIVQGMMQSEGGKLLTTVRGRAEALRSFSSMVALVPEDAEADSLQHRVLATAYGAQEYATALTYHQALVQEVATKPNKGVGIGPVAFWIP